MNYLRFSYYTLHLTLVCFIFQPNSYLSGSQPDVAVVWYEPTDVRKATKVFQRNEHWKKCLHFISPNRNELLAVARHFGISVPNDNHNLDLDTIKTIAEQVANYIPVVLTTLGSQGLLVSRKASDQEQFYDVNGLLIGDENSRVQTRLYPPLSLSSGSHDRIVSVSGCGDCLAAGVIYGIQEGMNEASCIRLALKAASLSLISFDPVPDTLSSINI